MNLGDKFYDDMNKSETDRAAIRQHCTIWRVILVVHIISILESAIDRHK